MAISNGKLTVGTAATLIPVTSVNPFTLRVHNDDNTDTLFLGNADVTAANGIRLVKLESFEIDLRPADRLYVVASKTGHSLSWLAVTKDI